MSRDPAGAVRAFREDLARRILTLTGAGESSRVLLLGASTTEMALLLAPHVREVFGTEATFDGRFDLVVAIFYLHRLPSPELAALPAHVRGMLNAGGVFYSIDPSSKRLAGAFGKTSDDERGLDPDTTAALFRSAGFEVSLEMYDFGSTPFAAMFPRWRTGYRLARKLDDRLLRMTSVRRMAANFEIVARNRD